MKVICIGRNYANHAKELNNPLPEQPVIFMKPESSLMANEEHFIRPLFDSDIHFEGELILRIGKNGKNINAQNARQHISEISVGIDFTARTLQNKLKNKGLPWALSKAFDQSAAIGNWIDLSPQWTLEDINFTLEKNCKLIQNGHSKNMLFSIEKIIAYASKYFTLQKGDIIFTGTPEGVGRICENDIFTGKLFNETVLNITIK